jgi:hypothetical protein
MAALANSSKKPQYHRNLEDYVLMVGGLSQRPNLTEGPAATWDSWRSIKEEELGRSSNTITWK